LVLTIEYFQYWFTFNKRHKSPPIFYAGHKDRLKQQINACNTSSGNRPQI